MDIDHTVVCITFLTVWTYMVSTDRHGDSESSIKASPIANITAFQQGPRKSDLEKNTIGERINLKILTIAMTPAKSQPWGSAALCEYNELNYGE